MATSPCIRFSKQLPAGKEWENLYFQYVSGGYRPESAVLPSLLNELLRPLRRGQVVSTTTTLGKIFPEKAPAIVQHGPEAVAVIEVGLLQIFVTKDWTTNYGHLYYADCSFTKGSGEIVKEVIKDGVGPWCNNPSDEGLAILRIEKLRTAEGECLFPRPGDSPLELSITVGDGQVCDALECAVLEMRPHETALVTCRDPSFLAGGAPLGEGPHLPRTTAFTFRVSLLDFNPGPDAPSFDEEDRVPFALRRKAEANRLFKEGRFRLARQRYFEITQLFHHLDKPELKDRFLGQPELFQECRKLRIECRLNMAACGIKLQDPRAAKEACQLVLQQMPENTKAFYRLAQAHLQERDFDQLKFAFTNLDAKGAPPCVAMAPSQLCRLRRHARQYHRHAHKSVVISRYSQKADHFDQSALRRHAAPVASWIAYGPRGRIPTVQEFKLLKKFMDKIDGVMLPSRLSDVLSDMQTVVRILPRPADDVWLKAERQLERSLRQLRHRCNETKAVTRAVAPDDDTLDADQKSEPDEALQVRKAEDLAFEGALARSDQHLTLFRKVNEWNFLDDVQKLERLQQAEVATRRPRRSLNEAELADIVNMAVAGLAAPRRRAAPQGADAECSSEATVAMESRGANPDLQRRVRSLLLHALHVWRINQFDCHVIEHVLDVVQGKISKFEDRVGEIRGAAAGKAWLNIKQAVDELMLRAAAPASSPVSGAEDQVEAAQRLKPHRVKPRLQRQSGIQNINWSVGRRCWACQYFSNKKGMKCKNTIRYFPVAKFLERGLGDEAAVDAALQEAKAYREELVRQGKLKPPKPKIYPDSMVRGVYFSQSQQKWKVQLYHPVKRKVVHGGYFSSQEKAEDRARDLASEFGVQPDIKVLPG
eukprot:s2817_g2.t2